MLWVLFYCGVGGLIGFFGMWACLIVGARADRRIDARKDGME